MGTHAPAFHTMTLTGFWGDTSAQFYCLTAEIALSFLAWSTIAVSIIDENN